jgi:8-oxo-dGTP pyrophosphatase MutT (NUDIX family)
MTGFMRGLNQLRARSFATDGYEGVTHAGLAVVAADTGNVLLAQRSMDPTDDEAVQETWEFPGGSVDPGEEPMEGAEREFREEMGFDLPLGDVVNGWRAGPEGNYQGFVYLIETEFDITGWTPTDEVQAVLWVHPTETDVINLRPEMADFDWSLLEVSRNQEDDMTEALTASAFAPGPIPIHGVLAPEATPSGDQRGFEANALTRRDALRLPFSWQKHNLPGHQGSVTVGSIDIMMRKDGLIHWQGELLDSEEAEEFLGLLIHFGRYGVSIDADKGSVSENSEEHGITWFDAGRISGATGCAIPAFAEAWVALGPHPDMPQAMPSEETLAASFGLTGQDFQGAVMPFDRGPGWVTHPTETKRIHDYWTRPGEEGYAKIAWSEPGDYRRCLTLVGEKIATNSPEDMRYMKRICAQWHHDALGYWPGDLGKPGNAPDTPENRKRAAIHAADETDLIERSDALDAELRQVVESVEGLEPVEDAGAEWEAVLVSSAAGVTKRPPLNYFHQHPSMVEDVWALESGALTVEEPDALGFRRVWGFAAEWGVCHVGIDGRCVEPPQTGSDDYPEFHLGRTRTEEGVVYTGLLTYGVGHRDAKKILMESASQQHFDNIKNAWAAVRVGENERGVWFSGVVLPKVDADDLVLIEASGQVSGEWKYGAMRTCLTVNVPGYPVEQPTAEYDANGNVVALAASAFGGVPNAPCNDTDDPVGDLAMAVWDRIEAKRRMDALREASAQERFAALRETWKA